MASKAVSATLSNLRAKHDPRSITRAKLNDHLGRLKKRGTEYQYERELLQEAGISPVHLRLVKREFSKHVALLSEIGKKVGRVTWFPNPAHATLMRKEQEQIKALMRAPAAEE